MSPRRVGLALVAFLAAACQKGGATPAASSPPVAMITLDQINARLAADKANGRVAVMHMWATWCGPCVEEFPHLARFYRDELAADHNVDFFAVSVDEPDSKAEVIDFINKNSATFPVFIADAPDQEAFAHGINPAWPSVLPTTFVYGLDGQTKDIEIGEVEDLPGFKQKIELARK